MGATSVLLSFQLFSLSSCSVFCLERSKSYELYIAAYSGSAPGSLFVSFNMIIIVITHNER